MSDERQVSERGAQVIAENIANNRRVELEYAISVLSSDPAAIQRMAKYLIPKVYMPPPFEPDDLIRGMLESASE